MAVSDIGHPFEGVAWYWVEDTYGGGGVAGDTLPISKYIQNITLGTGEKVRDIRSIEQATLADRIATITEPVLSIEYYPQVGDTMIEDTVERSSCCTLKSLAMEVGANTCTGAGSDDVTYYLATGMKPRSVKISSSKGEPYTVSIDFDCKSIVTDAAATGVEPEALTGAILQFNVAGEITKTGGHVVDTDHCAFITNAVDITIDHQLTGYTDHDSLVKSFLVEGTMDVSGSVDITLDGGGGMHWGEVLAVTDFNIIVTMGDDAGAPVLTLTGCNWNRSEVKVDISGEAMMESAPFAAAPSSCTGIVSYVAA